MTTHSSILAWRILMGLGTWQATVHGVTVSDAIEATQHAAHTCWSGLPFPNPGNLPDPEIRPISLASPGLSGRFFTISATWEALPCL